ncbi:hypothetical protein SAMN04488047_1498 [Tranquillimonas alkanivorans]|uniref:Uncharacterized protein n=1 Tax=Tranquillimonas alkanivorans TaxID=441119 RepID=A0A1I5WL93_9RHOB|nr:hypothetical protein SAMN04488047_1498 [Tranquillimonas alkanivorans]
MKNGGDATSAFDQAVAVAMELERAILNRPAETLRAMAMKIIVAARDEGESGGSNIAALIEEAREVLRY